MDLYTLEQADFLIKFYADKVIGQILEQSTQSTIAFLDKEQFSDNQYRVVAKSKVYQGDKILKRSIDKVAKDLNLDAPDVVLKNLSQP